jgi:hypothetical protein
MRSGSVEEAQLTAAAPTQQGWLYVSGALTPYDVESLCDHIVTLGRTSAGDVHVQIELGGASRNSPELRTLEHRMRRMRRQGVVVHLHAARSRVIARG